MLKSCKYCGASMIAGTTAETHDECAGPYAENRERKSSGRKPEAITEIRNASVTCRNWERCNRKVSALSTTGLCPSCEGKI